MEKILNMGAFEELDRQEMMDVDGGGFILGFVCGCIFAGVLLWPTNVY